MFELSRYKIHSGPKYYPYNSDLEGLVYNSEKYQQLNDLTQSWFFLIDRPVKRIVGRIVFSHQGDHMVSGAYAPFGSFEFREKVSVKERKAFIDYVLQHRGENKIIIKSYPYQIYREDLTLEILDSIYFDQVSTEINHHLDLTGRIEIHDMQKRKIRKCEEAGFGIMEITEPNDLGVVYDFIEKCRREQKLKINITKEKFLLSFKQLPKAYQAFAVHNNEKMIAASVLVKVNSEVVYHYLPASLKSMNKYSPMAFLTNHLTKYYSELGYKTFDWGITSIDGELQKSLAEFKERMGAQRSNKKTFCLL